MVSVATMFELTTTSFPPLGLTKIFILSVVFCFSFTAWCHNLRCSNRGFQNDPSDLYEGITIFREGTTVAFNLVNLEILVFLWSVENEIISKKKVLGAEQGDNQLQIQPHVRTYMYLILLGLSGSYILGN